MRKNALPQEIFRGFILDSRATLPLKDLKECIDTMVAGLARLGKQRAALLGWQGFRDTTLRNTERADALKRRSSDIGFPREKNRFRRIYIQDCSVLAGARFAACGRRREKSQMRLCFWMTCFSVRRLRP